MRRQLLFLVTAAIAVAICLWLAFSAWVAWSICCGGFFGTPLWLPVGLTFGAVVNALGLIFFVLGRETWGRAGLAIVQGWNIAFSLVAALAISPVWLITDTTPAAVVLTFALVLLRVQPTSQAEPSN